MLDVNGVRVDEPITNDVSENLYWDYIDEKLEDKYQESKVSAYFSSIDDFGGKLAFIQKKLKQFKIDNSDMGSCKLEIKEHKQEDWENSWKQYFKPIKITDKVVVKPQWEEYTGENNEIIINIDPGMGHLLHLSHTWKNFGQALSRRADGMGRRGVGAQGLDRWMIRLNPDLWCRLKHTLQQHGIAIAEEAVTLGDGVLVQGHDVLVAGKGAYQHQQGAFGQVEIGQQHVHHLELESRGDEDARFSSSLPTGGPALQSAHAGGAHGYDSPASRPAGGNGLNR